MTISTPLTNFASYIPPSSTHPRIGHLDLNNSTIIPLSHPSGTPLTNLHEVIDAGRAVEFVPSSRHEPPLDLSSVTLLPPVPGRDVLLAVSDENHAAEGRQPTGARAPAVFARAASGIVACGSEAFLRTGWTETLDCGGRVGVILGKGGFGIAEEDAWDHVWGFTIINDVTAREKRPDQGQFLPGESADTFCPMGSIAVPITSLRDHRSLRITAVNGVLHQDSTLSESTFSVPTLVSIISRGRTVRPGDVLAAGTPAGIGIGRAPPTLLSPGDVVEISVSELGTLANKISATGKRPCPHPPLPPPSSPVRVQAQVQANLMTLPNEKLVHVERHGDRNSPNVLAFVHGLGGNTTFYHPLLNSPALLAQNVIMYDLEGHGRTPTRASSRTSVRSYADDLHELLLLLLGGALSSPAGSRVSLVAHSFGALVALVYASAHPVHNLLLLAPAAAPLPPTGVEAILRRAERVRVEGMSGVAESVLDSATSARTKAENPAGVALVREILRGNDVEGYAKCCGALARFSGEEIEWERGIGVGGKKVVVAGEADRSVSLEAVREIAGRVGAGLVVLEGVGHWLAIEDVEGVRRVVERVVC